VLEHAEATEIRRAARKEGMRTMYEDGLRKALAGITTLEEVLRVVADD
jgi:general secretion pathway protein E